MEEEFEMQVVVTLRGYGAQVHQDRMVETLKRTLELHFARAVDVERVKSSMSGGSSSGGSDLLSRLRRRL